jgi:hypothetical protein
MVFFFWQPSGYLSFLGHLVGRWDTLPSLVIFLLVAILTSVSSGLWLVTAIYQVVNGSIRVSTRILVMLILSAVPTLFCVLYLAKT